ncbi:MAG TPA: tripartite tricarboxylate transporter substrate binding protein, partial [Burkholderiales bacterium]|nr:tripartite tricarboxylate transporter substrate binding protein [Burkholderiales bacterium]
PIRFIVPFPPGGGNDTMARAFGQKMSEDFAQPVVIDNRPGAGGNIGAETAARALPDGYTVFLGGVGSHGINPNLQAKLPYDPIKDFAPISLIASAPLVIVVPPSLPIKTVSDLVQLAKARPGELNYASSGSGTIAHLSAELLNSMAKIKLEHVPYKGTGPALTDLLAGRVQVMFNSAVSILPQVRSGKLRALAMTAAKRSAAMPDLPTVAESGVPGYEAASWYGVLAPAGTPRPIMEKLNSEIVRIARTPEVRERLAADGADPVGSSPEEFAAYIKLELARWARVIDQARIPRQ